MIPLSISVLGLGISTDFWFEIPEDTHIHIEPVSRIPFLSRVQHQKVLIVSDENFNDPKLVIIGDRRTVLFVKELVERLRVIDSGVQA